MSRDLNIDRAQCSGTRLNRERLRSAYCYPTTVPTASYAAPNVGISGVYGDSRSDDPNDSNPGRSDYLRRRNLMNDGTNRASTGDTSLDLKDI